MRVRACGVNVDELLLSQPGTGEQALEITETLIRSGGVDCVVVDSVAALVPRAEIEGEMGDSFVGIQARLMSQALRKLTGAVSRSNTALIFTNQLREKIGVMFGNPETMPGGRALKFYASVRLDIRRVETIKTGTESNHVTIRAAGPDLGVSINGQPVLQARDGTFASGDIALGAITWDEPAEARFDNLIAVPAR